MAEKKEYTEKAAQAAPGAPKAAGSGEPVKIRLFKDGDKYKDDVFVAVNGRSWQIKRGEEVLVPRYVAEVLEQSVAQDQSTAKLIETKSGEFAAEAERRGV